MTISYGLPTHQTAGSGAPRSEALVSYASLVEGMSSNNIDIMGDGIKDVLTNQVAFAEFSQHLQENLQPELQADMAKLANNTRKVMLEENFMSGMHPVTALSLPLLRVGYPKLAVREGIPTEPVEQPKFAIKTRRPYVLDPETRKRLPLPQAFSNRSELFGLPTLQKDEITATDGTIKDYDLLTPVGKSAANHNEIDPDFTVVVIKDDQDKEHKVSFRLDTGTNVISGEVRDTDDTLLMTVFGNVDRREGKMNLTSIGERKIKAVKIIGYISSEANTAATVVGFDITSEEVVIGTGHPIESPINTQAMMDVMNTYKIDATMANLEIMSTALAQSIDLEGVRFLNQTFEKDPSVKDEFDVRPAAGFALGETQWREEMKIKLDRLVTKLQTRLHMYSGRTVIFAHPLDAQVLTNVRWQYSNQEQPNAVSVSHRLGSFSSSVTNYTLLQSPNFQQGEMLIMYIPDDPEFRTSMYFPYSFNTIRGAASPNIPDIPSIQMLQRSTFRTFTPAMAKLVIRNNDA